MSPDLSMSWWIDRVVEAAREVAELSLGGASFEMLSRTQGLPSWLEGSTIALVGDRCSTQIGLWSNDAGCKRLAGLMLGMGPDEELEDDGVTDAICELANVLAGVVKTKIAANLPGFQLGMPMYFRGALNVANGTEAGSAEAQVSDVRLHLIVLKSQR